jgi:hypothetical protein
MPNVFISHRLSDNAQAELLAIDIRNAGHKVWLDLWEIGIGDSITGRMNEGLEGSSYIVLCYSDAGILSPWISQEWLNALARQLNGEGVKILPVRLTGGKPPAILAGVKYADFVNDWAKALAELLRAIK